jgi:putative methyltransferase (TIGR04325 family)
MTKIDHWQPTWQARFPLLVNLERRRYRQAFARPESSGWFAGVYADRASAQRDAPPTQPLGYDNPASARLYTDRLSQVYVSDYPMMFWLEKLLASGARRILDIGGHVGVAFFAYQRYFPFPDDIEWTVQEVPAVVEAGAKRAASKGVSHQLRFTPELPEVGQFDVVFSSGALQYLEPSLGQIIERLRFKPG